ncbi:ParB/RepB/Spo0J family partition protein (plasmid) [Dyella sp. BiH032]|uniref:ParB/RepB/Spo0J family partition protein n=1 Tax=Dyella sp. BiH032 TaxID=3075430 RepID=UPI002892B0C2|nr:ParB/RepB/Spo0J family partition protein [Dyella sp. BiH032]WNL48578.1 ParB/RepB/Spo0J family partition protein [Dyella sp. BiH032]
MNANLRMSALDALGSADEPEIILMIDVTDIERDPNQPRKELDQEKIEGLARSFKLEGQLDPIEVRMNPDPSGKPWILVNGENRWWAAPLAGFTQLRALERRHDDDPKARRKRQFASNYHRSDMTARDTALYLQDVLEDEKTIEKVAEVTGVSISQVSKLLSVLNLSGVAKEASEQGLAKDPEVLAQLATLEKVSPADATALVESAKAGEAPLTRKNVREKTKEAKGAKNAAKGGKGETKGKGKDSSKGGGMAPPNQSFGGAGWEAPRPVNDGKEYGSVRMENDGPSSRPAKAPKPMPVIYLEFIGDDADHRALWDVMLKHGKAALCMIAGSDAEGCLLVQFGDTDNTEAFPREALRIASVEYPA